MRKRLKQFIEGTIDDIERGDWNSIFRNWYNNEAALLEQDNDENIQELFTVLRQVYPNIEKDSLDARKQVILEQFIHYIQHRMKEPEAATAFFDSAVSTLLMCLGFEDDDLLEIFKDAAVQCGFDRPATRLVRLR